MPKILNYTPPWLSRPSPGFDLFDSADHSSSTAKYSNASPPTNGTSSEPESPGPRRTIAHRGTEVFLVVRNQIRWADLSLLKDDWESTHRRRKNSLGTSLDRGSEYKILRVPVSEKIRQLAISPNGQLLAIATSHTVHVATLPDSAKFDEDTTTPIKLQTHTLGPTTHVLSQSPVQSILWHPCSAGGTCLVTVTAEAAVRVWELNRSNRWSFDSPALAIDLRKLEAASSQSSDTSPRRMDANRGYSTDMIDMELASACFGGTGSPEESPWSALTLWTVTTEGDVYALCPLLPSKWQPTSTQLPALSVTATTQAAATKEDGIQSDQLAWLSDIDAQVPLPVARDDDLTICDAVYNRPAHPGPLPKLQGPFELSAGSVADFLDVSDIHVIASKLDTEEMMFGEDSDSEQGVSEEENGKLSAAAVCLLTTDGRVFIFLDLDGVEGRWLPAKPPKSQPIPPVEVHELVLLEALDTLPPETLSENEWPTFSPDPFSRYAFFTTHSQGAYFFTLDPWIPRLESELQNAGTEGSEFRLKVLRESAGTLRERILRFDHGTESANAVVCLHDSDVGYFLLTSTSTSTDNSNTQELVSRARDVGGQSGGDKTNREGEEGGGFLGVGNLVRKRKVEQVMGMLERESMLVEGVRGRLERLAMVGMGM
ncbi:MAG: hypothetical protein Q9220_006345 [cf. Caloplaca sp. 1 TL-2023]